MPAGSPQHHLEIKFRDGGGTRATALELAGEILDQWGTEVAGVNLVPIGEERFEVLLDGESIYAMAESAGQPERKPRPTEGKPLNDDHPPKAGRRGSNCLTNGKFSTTRLDCSREQRIKADRGQHPCSGAKHQK